MNFFNWNCNQCTITIIKGHCYHGTILATFNFPFPCLDYNDILKKMTINFGEHIHFFSPTTLFPHLNLLLPHFSILTSLNKGFKYYLMYFKSVYFRLQRLVIEFSYNVFTIFPCILWNKKFQIPKVFYRTFLDLFFPFMLNRISEVVWFTPLWCKVMF